MAGVKALRKLQLGKESTAGTNVATTVIYRGMGVGRDATETRYPEEDVGVLAVDVSRGYEVRNMAEITFEESDATFEQLPYIFEAGVEAETPTQDGAGSDYIYTYNMPISSQNTINTYSIEGGDDQQAYEASYCFVKEFTITGSDDGVLSVSADWVGRQWTKTSFTSLSNSTVESIPFSNAKIYMDDTGTFPATTQLTNHLMNFELTVTTGLIEKFTASGEKYFSHHVQVRPESSLNLVVEHDTNAVALFDDFQANTVKSIRLEFTGSAVATPGTTYSNKQFFIDLLGQINTGPELDDVDGNDTLSFELTAGWTSADASAGRFIVVNELSALV